MLHVLSFGERPTPDGVIRAMFAARKSVFVDLLKWDVPVLGGLYEVDQFDDEHARYLILADSEERHLGSARLLPTTRPHILDSFYPGLCAEPPPRGEHIYEITRFCLDRRLRAAARRAVRDTLVASLVDHALANGIERYSAIAEIGWFQQILSFGWHCHPLGLPCSADGGTLVALSIAIAPDTPALLDAAQITAHPSILADKSLAAA